MPARPKGRKNNFTKPKVQKSQGGGGKDVTFDWIHLSLPIHSLRARSPPPGRRRGRMRRSSRETSSAGLSRSTSRQSRGRHARVQSPSSPHSLWRGSHLGRPFSSGAKEPPTQPMPAQRIEDREGMGPRIARIQHMGTRAKHINRQLSSFSFPFAHVWRSEVGRWERRREGRRKGQNESLPRNFSSSPFSSSLCTRIERGK